MDGRSRGWFSGKIGVRPEPKPLGSPPRVRTRAIQADARRRQAARRGSSSVQIPMQMRYVAAAGVLLATQPSVAQELKLDPEPGWGVGLEAYAGLTLLVTRDEDYAHGFAGGLTRLRWWYLQVGGYVETSDRVERRIRSRGWTNGVLSAASRGVSSLRSLDRCGGRRGCQLTNLLGIGSTFRPQRIRAVEPRCYVQGGNLGSLIACPVWRTFGLRGRVFLRSGAPLARMALRVHSAGRHAASADWPQPSGRLLRWRPAGCRHRSGREPTRSRRSIAVKATERVPLRAAPRRIARRTG